MSDPADRSPRDIEKDPYTEWLLEVDKGDKDKLWTPVILAVPANVPDVPALVKELASILEHAKSDKGEPLFLVNFHDWWHWLKQLTQHPDDISELIFFHTSLRTAESETETALKQITALQAGEQNLRLIAEGLPINVGPVTSPEDADQDAPSDPADPLPHTFEAAIETANKNRDPDLIGVHFDLGADAYVVTAIIDHGIPYLNERTTTQNGFTRVAAIWRQGEEPHSSSGGSRFGELEAPILGDVLVKPDLDAQLVRLHDNPLEENEFNAYMTSPGQSGFHGPASSRSRKRGTRKYRPGDHPLGYSVTHGALMLDIAAGAEPGSVRDTSNPILAVELPPQLVARSNGFLHEPYVKSALNWINYQVAHHPGLARAKTEVIVNYSFSDHAGRHEGQGMLDADFQRRIETGEVSEICVPSGNSYLMDCHATLRPKDIQSGEDLELWVQPDSKTATFVQIWLEDAYPDKLPFQLDITPPGHAPFQVTPCLPDNSFITLLGTHDAPVARIYRQTVTPHYALPAKIEPRSRLCLTLAIRPTGRYGDRDQLLAPSGRWRLSFSETPEVTTGDPRFPDGEVINIWVERNDTVPGFPARGRQSYLAHPKHDPYDKDSGRPLESARTGSPIERSGTMGSNSNARNVTAAAAFQGYRKGRKRPAAYSAAGKADTEFGQPEAAFCAADSDARRDIMASGTLSGSRARANGTSAAAALAARAHVDQRLEPRQIQVSATQKGRYSSKLDDLSPDPVFEQQTKSDRTPVRVGNGAHPIRFSGQVSRFTDHDD